MKHWMNRLLIAASALVLVGCASSRSEVGISVPTVSQTAAATARPQAGQKLVWLRTVKDSRVFQAAPKDPSIPSLGFGGADQASAEVKARAMGRKRNGFGAGLGDVLLPEGQTVTLLLSQQLRTVLQEGGYQVVEQDPKRADALVVDVDVKEFWSWIQMGFWSLKLHNKAATELWVENSAKRMMINSAALQSRQLVTDGAWKEIVELSLADYRQKLKTQWLPTLEK